MSVSITYKEYNTDEAVSLSVVGDSELHELWIPIIQECGLEYMDYVVTAGLSLDSDNYYDVLSEVRQLLAELEQRQEFRDDITNPVFRCRRLLEVLEAHSPERGAELYIG